MKTVLAVAATTVGILLLLGLRVWLYPAVLSAPHGGGSAISSVIGLAILVVVYALVAVVILSARSRGAERSSALRRATLLGALVGGCALVAIVVDTLAGAESTLSLVVWPLVILAALIGWGLAGLLTTRAGWFVAAGRRRGAMERHSECSADRGRRGGGARCWQLPATGAERTEAIQITSTGAA